MATRGSRIGMRKLEDILMGPLPVLTTIKPRESIRHNASTLVGICQQYPSLATHLVKHEGSTYPMSPLLFLIVSQIDPGIVQAFIQLHKDSLSCPIYLKNTRPLHYACAACFCSGVIGVLIRAFPDQLAICDASGYPIDFLSRTALSNYYFRDMPKKIEEDFIDLVNATDMNDISESTASVMLSIAWVRPANDLSNAIIMKITNKDYGLFPSSTDFSDYDGRLSLWHGSTLAKLHETQTIDDMDVCLDNSYGINAGVIEKWLEAWKNSAQLLRNLQVEANDPIHPYEDCVFGRGTAFETFQTNLLQMTNLQSVRFAGDGWFSQEEYSLDITSAVVNWIKINKAKSIEVEQFSVDAAPVLEALAENTSLTRLNLPEAKMVGDPNGKMLLEGTLSLLKEKNRTLVMLDLWPHNGHPSYLGLHTQINYYLELNWYRRAETLKHNLAPSQLVKLMDGLKKGTRGKKEAMLKKRVSFYYDTLRATTTIWCSKESLARKSKKRTRAKSKKHQMKGAHKKRTKK